MTNSWDAAINAANKQKGINAGRGPGADAFCCFKPIVLLLRNRLSWAIFVC